MHEGGLFLKNLTLILKMITRNVTSINKAGARRCIYKHIFKKQFTTIKIKILN